MKYDPDNPLISFNREAFADMRECVHAYRQANHSRDEAIAELKTLAGIDTALLEVAAQALEIEWPGNGDDGPPLIAKRNPQSATLPSVKLPQSKNPAPLLVRWLRAVSSSAGPTGPAIRGVLHTLALYAGDRNRPDGGGVYPGLKRLAEDTGTSLSALKRYLQIAEREGWIARTQRHRDGTHELSSSAYEFTVPSRVGPITGLRSVKPQRVRLLSPEQRGKLKRQPAGGPRVGPILKKGRPGLEKR